MVNFVHVDKDDTSHDRAGNELKKRELEVRSPRQKDSVRSIRSSNSTKAIEF